ncbi:MAG: hypothetical protein J6K13_04330 [Clostridia bacterium]|nr:hypothetical protein [Clostridia bacterium]
MMKKKMVDERIHKASNALLAKFYWVMLALQAVVLAVKLCLEPEVVYWVLDGIILLAGLGVMAVMRSIKGLWGKKDEALKEMDDSVLSTSFGTMLWVTLIGSEIMIFGDAENALWYGATILPLLICCAIYTVLVVKRGLILWGGKQNEGDTKKRLRKSTALGALVYGAIMAASDCFRYGEFRVEGLIKLVLMAAMWGLLFYGLMVLVINRGEKAANKTLEEVEANGEE